MGQPASKPALLAAARMHVGVENVDPRLKNRKMLLAFDGLSAAERPVLSFRFRYDRSTFDSNLCSRESRLCRSSGSPDSFHWAKLVRCESPGREDAFAKRPLITSHCTQMCEHHMASISRVRMMSRHRREVAHAVTWQCYASSVTPSRRLSGQAELKLTMAGLLAMLIAAECRRVSVCEQLQTSVEN